MTDAMELTLRPEWLEKVVVAYGEPKVSSERFGEVPVLRSEDGLHARQFWVWFPSKINHNISIDTYRNARRVVVSVRSHGPQPRVTVEMFEEPSEEFMGKLIELTNFTSTPMEAADA